MYIRIFLQKADQHQTLWFKRLPNNCIVLSNLLLFSFCVRTDLALIILELVNGLEAFLLARGDFYKGMVIPYKRAAKQANKVCKKNDGQYQSRLACLHEMAKLSI